MQILLGSNSPRRNELLKQMGFDFEKVEINCDESFPGIETKNVAMFLAKKKSLAYHKLKENELLITGDTVVVLDDQILNKPISLEDASSMLNALGGRSHLVITGVCIRTLDKQVVFDVVTEVEVDKLTENEIDFYIDNFKPFDKAGSYGIQEWFGLNKVKSINGCFYNVVGLPCNELYKRLIDDFELKI